MKKWFILVYVLLNCALDATPPTDAEYREAKLALLRRQTLALEISAAAAVLQAERTKEGTGHHSYADVQDAQQELERRRRALEQSRTP